MDERTALFPSSGLLFLHGEKLNAVGGGVEWREGSGYANKHPKKSWANICCKGGANIDREGGGGEDVYGSSEHEMSSYFAYTIQPTHLPTLVERMHSAVFFAN